MDTPDRTDTNAQDVQPTHEPIVEPYDGPTDKASVISAVISGVLTTRQAADLLATTTDQVRAWKARETARRARPVKAPIKPASRATQPRVFRPVSPIIDIPDDHAQIVDSEPDSGTETPETPESETEVAQSLQTLQFQPPETLSEGGETPETITDGQTETPSTPPSEPETTRPAPDKRAIALANIAKAHAAQARMERKPPTIDAGSFERDELDTLDNLHRIITRNAKRAESGKDCQGWTASLAIVLDLRRRAAGKQCTLVKEPAKATSTRNSIVFIGNPQASPSPTPSLKVAKLQPVIEQAPCLTGSPPALDTSLKAAPAYVRGL